MSGSILSSTSPYTINKKVKVSRYTFSEPLKVIVGPNAEEFFINEEFICKQSRYFKTVCRKAWQSGRLRTVTLVDDDPRLFAIFLFWLAKGDIESSSDFIEITDPEYTEGEMIEKRCEQWEQLRRCYNLGDDLLAPAFKNAVMDCLITVSDYLITDHKLFPCRMVQELEIIYETTYPGSGLRKLIVDLAVKYLDLESVENLDVSRACLADFYSEMLGRVCTLLKDCTEEDAADTVYLAYPWEIDSSDYHDKPNFV
ncbi:hypothetical protein DL98DRAFT_536708 [Cadophora sp. DSE1049]|nr:hypothetical protein DL98DRAFT_536708 [Cadophora sp. DSE1049]